ncbi:MAG: hypothetical protein ACEPOV_13505 [Hyphomicrobiales bacterium]
MKKSNFKFNRNDALTDAIGLGLGDAIGLGIGDAIGDGDAVNDADA